MRFTKRISAKLFLVATFVNFFHLSCASEVKNNSNGAYLRSSPNAIFEADKLTEVVVEENKHRRSLEEGYCSSKKKVTLKKFCIEGQCDHGSEGEHRLKLAGDWLWNGYKDLEEDKCHDMSHTRIIEGWKSLTVGTEEHDSTSQNDSYFATMPSKEWFDPTCEKYSIRLSTPHTHKGAYTACYSARTTAIKSLEICGSLSYPEESFVWELEIEPDDSPIPPILKSCKSEKKISMYKFCIEGDCDAGAEGEHQLYLNNQALYGGFRDYREGQCHNINEKSSVLQSNKSLSVGTIEEDGFLNPNDHYSAYVAASEWYDSTCEPYEIIISKEHTGEQRVSRCIWFTYTPQGGSPLHNSHTIKACDEWVEPPQSFIWMMKVEALPNDPPPVAACMSGETGVKLVSSKDSKPSDTTNLRSSSLVDTIVEVSTLNVGDNIRGLDENQKPAVCTVEAVGTFGSGPVYGNYTHGHYILDLESGDVKEHGRDQTMSIQDQYDVLTSCPVGVDETGKAFTALDTDFCGGFTEKMSWSDYLHLHKGILRMVRGTGGYWFHGSSYVDFGFLKDHAPVVCSTMLRCVKDHDDCFDFEDASALFIEKAVSSAVKDKAYNTFPSIGRHWELGSVSAMLSSGGSVRK